MGRSTGTILPAPGDLTKSGISCSARLGVSRNRRVSNGRAGPV
jgi:hypothetical protein